MKKLITLLMLVFIGLSIKAQWQPTSGPLFSTGQISCFLVKGTNIFAGTNGGGVYLSTDQGISWTAVNNGISSTEVILSMSMCNDTIFAGTQGDGVFLSANNGTNWSCSEYRIVIFRR